MEAVRMADSAVIGDVSSVLEQLLTDARSGLVPPLVRAADASSELITMGRVLHALARQYQREARVLRSTELGPYAVLRHGHG
jgi:hypothetical protein